MRPAHWAGMRRAWLAIGVLSAGLGCNSDGLGKDDLAVPADMAVLPSDSLGLGFLAVPASF